MRLRTRVCCELVRLEHPLKASHSLLLRRAIVIAGIFFGSDKRRLVLRARGRLSRIAQLEVWWVRQTAAPLFLQKDVEEGVVNPNLAVIFDEAQLPEAIHEKTHSGSGCANHLSQCLLAHLWNHRLGFAFLAELSEQ